MPDLPIIFDSISIQDEAFMFVPELNIDIFDSISISEVVFRSPAVYSVSVLDNIAILTDIVKFGFTPKFVNVFDSLSILEILGVFDLTEEGINVDEISVVEYVSLERKGNFNDFLRTYPFVQRTLTGFTGAEFENGVVQERDTWGRYKKLFEVIFPPLTKQQALDVEEFFTVNKGTIFDFTHPFNGLTYQVRIADNELLLSRSAFNTYYTRMTIEEVF